MPRPKIKIKKETLDIVLEITSISVLVFVFGYILFQFNSLPEEIPSHFDSTGTPDDYQSKNSIWILPIIGLVIYLFITFLSQYPHTFNYMVKITEENAETQYRKAVRMINIIKTITIVAFGYISLISIQIAKGFQSGLGFWFVPVLIASLLGVVFFSLKNNPNQEF